jgi:hypothetical protein
LLRGGGWTRLAVCGGRVREWQEGWLVVVVIVVFIFTGWGLVRREVFVIWAGCRSFLTLHVVTTV